MRKNFSNPSFDRGTRLAKLLLIGILGFSQGACSDRDRGVVSVGQPFPLAALVSAPVIGGQAIDLEGKTLLINFWATWCAPCRVEMPELQALSDTLDPDRYAVIGIAVEEDGNLVREFLLEHQIRFAILQDPAMQISTRLLGIETYPASFIVSPQGIIQRRILGRRDWDAQIFAPVAAANPDNPLAVYRRPLPE